MLLLCFLNHVSCVNFDTIYDDTIYDDEHTTLEDGVMETDNIAYPSTAFPTVLSSTEARRKVTDVVTTKPGDEARKRGQVGRAARRKRIKMGDSGKFQIFLSTTFQNYFTLNR